MGPKGEEVQAVSSRDESVEIAGVTMMDCVRNETVRERLKGEPY